MSDDGPKNLHAPWRMPYIKSLEDPEARDPLVKLAGGCFLCAAARLDDAPEPDRCDAAKKRLVIWETPHSVCLVNRYPYTGGHLMVAPRRHVAELDELTTEEALDSHHQVVHAIKLLKKLMNPQGFNVGLNLGRCAGAGVPGHLHRHVVPRWNGDTNFMSVVGDVRILPQAPEALWDGLRNLLRDDSPPAV